MKLALFDLDQTLLPLDSDHAWGDYTVSLGWCDADTFKQANDRFYEQYKAQELDLQEYVAFATAAFREQGEEKALQAREQYIETVIRPAVEPQAMDLVEQAQRSADEVVLITATNAFVTRPIANLFGIEHLIAVNLQKDAATGWYNGAIEGTPSFREGKCTRLMQWLAERGLEWGDVEHSVFYSDSINDLPLLEQVHQAVATNPDPSLEQVATERGWEILRLWDAVDA